MDTHLLTSSMTAGKSACLDLVTVMPRVRDVKIMLTSRSCIAMPG